jgi:hypothetical protein
MYFGHWYCKDIETVIGNSFSKTPAIARFQLHMQDRFSLLDLPAQNLHAYMQISRSPHQTSACILVPTTKGPWTQYRFALTVIKELPRALISLWTPEHSNPYQLSTEW